MNAAPVITAEHFQIRTGHAPEDDDLDRSNCPKAGQIAHTMCGWDSHLDLPVFMTGNQSARLPGGKPDS